MGTQISKLFVDVATLPGHAQVGKGMTSSLPEPACPLDKAGKPTNCNYFGGFFQLLFLGAVYAFILFSASNKISDGSELLLLVPEWKGLIGSIVLPVLGAVPDGAIIIFSGLGPADSVKTQIDVGVGALAGSTIMLLTIPWFLAILYGRVNLNEQGEAEYTPSPLMVAGQAAINSANESQHSMNTGDAESQPLNPDDKPTQWEKRSDAGWMNTGITVGPSIAKSGKFMLLTCISLLVIQVPSFALKCSTKNETTQDKLNHTECQGNKQKWICLVGFLTSLILFFVYLGFQKYEADKDMVLSLQGYHTCRRAIVEGTADLKGLKGQFEGEGEELLEDKIFQKIMHFFFHHFDTDKSGKLDLEEIEKVCVSLRMPVSSAKVILEQSDSGPQDGQVDENEFSLWVATQYLSGKQDHLIEKAKRGRGKSMVSEQKETVVVSKDDEEEDEMPEELADLSPEEQQSAIKKEAFKQMAIGVIVVLVVSDPMVDVLSELGARAQIPAFYVAFVLAPLASNASELLAAINYAKKKTEDSLTIATAGLVGAACMNNTFCLSIFLILIFARTGVPNKDGTYPAGKVPNLEWSFTAETLSILAVQLIMFYFTQKKTQKGWHAWLILSLFPLSILLVIVLENGAGLN